MAEAPIVPPRAVTPPPPAPIRTVPPVVTSSLFEEPTIDDPVIAPADRPAALATLAAEVSVCNRCPHLTDSALQSSKDSSCHYVVADIEFSNFRQRGDRANISISKPMTGGD